MGSCVHKAKTWHKVEKHHCSRNTVGGSFKTAADAQKYCAAQGSSKCSGVYDDSCDNKGTFYACNLKPHLSSGIGSCVHKLAGTGVNTTKSDDSYYYYNTPTYLRPC